MKHISKQCEQCGEETIHSYKKVLSPTRGKLRREVTKCTECGKTTIKNNRHGMYTISGKNAEGI